MERIGPKVGWSETEHGARMAQNDGAGVEGRVGTEGGVG